MKSSEDRDRSLDGCRAPELWPQIESGWRAVRDAGRIAYDPAAARVVEHDGLSFYYIPGRGNRPGAAALFSGGGLLKPHGPPCPFDDAAALRSRQVAAFRREERSYRLIANRFPVTALHLLMVRDPDAPEDTLAQCLFGPEEIEDALRLARMIGFPLRMYFNSNAGADGSNSGSTVNHWHFQLFPHHGGPMKAWLDRSPEVGEGTGMERGRLPHWQIPHRLYRSADLASLSESVWDDVERCHRRDCAYNVEIAAGRAHDVTAAVFPRAPLDPIELDGIGAISARFGGWELSGDVVIYDPAVFDWVRDHPDEAAALARDRLARGTRSVWA